MRMAGKIGIVTAAASGMGRARALRFAREGAAVGVADIDQAGVEAVVREIEGSIGRRSLHRRLRLDGRLGRGTAVMCQMSRKAMRTLRQSVPLTEANDDLIA